MLEIKDPDRSNTQWNSTPSKEVHFDLGDVDSAWALSSFDNSLILGSERPFKVTKEHDPFAGRGSKPENRWVMRSEKHGTFLAEFDTLQVLYDNLVHDRDKKTLLKELL